MTILFFDIETAALLDAGDWVEEPAPHKGYKDPEKIKAYVDEKKAAALEKAALDPDLGQIVALSYCLYDPEYNNPVRVIARDRQSEDSILRTFWRLYLRADCSCGYNILGFDFPFILRRSMALEVEVPVRPNLSKYGTDEIDLMGVLYNWSPQARGLKWVAKRYGIPNPLPDLDGSHVQSMLDEGDWATLKEYAKNDLRITMGLWHRMSTVYFDDLRTTEYIPSRGRMW